jgi:transcriptional regulator with XRE-family HTH domain
MRVRGAFGHVTRMLRQNNNLSLRQTSALTGISIAHLSEFERGKKEMSSELSMALCKGIGIKQSDFMFLAYRAMLEVERREAIKATAKTN